MPPLSPGVQAEGAAILGLAPAPYLVCGQTSALRPSEHSRASNPLPLPTSQLSAGPRVRELFLLCSTDQCSARPSPCPVPGLRGSCPGPPDACQGTLAGQPWGLERYSAMQRARAARGQEELLEAAPSAPQDTPRGPQQ